MTSRPPSALTASGVHADSASLGLRDQPLQSGVIVRRLERGRAKFSALHALDGAAGMLRDGDDLETQRQHVRRQPRLDHRFRVDVLFAKMLQTALEEAADGAEGLKIIRHAGVVE